MNIKEYDIKLSIIIVLILGTVLSTTYAFLNLQANNNSDSSIAGCFEVNYEGTVLTDDLTSTNNYLEGTHAQITLSKDESCKIYTQATIYVHTTSTTAPINETQALKYKVLLGSTTLAEGFITNDNGSDKSLTTVTLSDTPTTYDVYIWVDKSLTNGQYNNKTYSGYIYASSDQTSTIVPVNNAFAEEVMEPNAQSDSSINFSQTSEASNTNGVYIRSGTENNTNPIYYYRGNVDNNNMIFADTCWKIVRTTETGGLKLIYNGVPSNGECNNTGTASQIGTKKFNSANSPAYVGYMYSTVYPITEKTMSDDAYYYGNGVTYSNGTYTLNSATSLGVWADTYKTGLNNNHYTCYSTTGTTCVGEVYYVYYTDTFKASYITLTNGKDIEDALFEMFGSDDANQDNYNTISSVIKGNNTTQKTLDYWYYTNISQKGYSNYIEDTVWCNDRTIYNIAGWDPNGGSTTQDLTFGGNGRLNSTKQPNLTCSREIDSFTVNESNGNGKLDYPVGLLTSDEIMLAGGSAKNNDSYYLYTGNAYWAGSPSYFDYFAHESVVTPAGALNSYQINFAYGVRPSVSLAPGFSIVGGNGTAATPYIVQ